MTEREQQTEGNHGEDVNEYYVYLDSVLAPEVIIERNARGQQIEARGAAL